MNAARKALIKIQTAPPGVPVGRFQPQVAIISDFFDSLVNLKIENNALHRQLLEAHERFGKLLGDSEVPPAAKVDQAQTASKLRGNSFNLLIIDEYAKLNEGAPAGYEINADPSIPFNLGRIHTYKEYVVAGWTDTHLIAKGILVKVQPNA